MAAINDIYGGAKTGKEFTDANLQTGRVWVAYVDLRCVKDHIISSKDEWRNGNLYPVMGTIWKDRDNGTDIVGKLPLSKDVKTKLAKKFHTNDTYIYLQLTVYSACKLYGNSVGKNASKSNRFESRFYLPIDQKNDMIKNVESKFGRMTADFNEIEKKIEESLKTGTKGSAQGVGNAKFSGKYVSDKPNKYSSKKQESNNSNDEKSNDLIYNGPKPKNKRNKKKNKNDSDNSGDNSSDNGDKQDERVKITEQYQVTLNNGDTVTATVIYHGPPDSKVVKIGAKKIF